MIMKGSYYLQWLKQSENGKIVVELAATLRVIAQVKVSVCAVLVIVAQLYCGILA
jgi:hypothetical protein